MGSSPIPGTKRSFFKKGTYIYALMSGFGSQRVKGTIKSIMIGDELIKVNLSLYDTDGLEGLYVPNSSFRETSKDVASGAMSNTSTLTSNNGSTGNSLTQWGTQAITNAVQKTSNAISKAIKKNSAKQLREAVCSPGGSTIEGVKELESREFYDAVMSAIKASYDKNVLLGNK